MRDHEELTGKQLLKRIAIVVGAGLALVMLLDLDPIPTGQPEVYQPPPCATAHGVDILSCITDVQK